MSEEIKPVSFTSTYIRTAALRKAVKAANRRISLDAIKEFDAFVGAKIADIVAHQNGKKTIDTESLVQVGAARSVTPVVEASVSAA